MKHLFIIFSILLLSSPLFGDNHKGETLYLWKTSSSVQWYRFGDKYSRPQYKGEVENWKPNGLGVLIYPYNAKSIVGEWKNGKEWKTKHRTKNGSLILKFEMGKNGQVTFTSPDGRKYVGEWKDGKQNGQGKMTLPDGEKYEGKFKDGIPNGQGIYISPDGRMYVGEFKDGIPNGQGTYISPDGRMDVGEWKDGKTKWSRNIHFPDGTKYVGEFKDGKTWNGTEYYKNGNIIGKWVNGVLQKKIP